MTAPDPDAAGDESQLLLDLISDGVLVIDGDGVLRSANQAGRDLLGMDLEAPGKTWSVGWEFLEVDGSAVSPEDDPIRTCRRGGRRVFDRQLRLRRNDHSVLAVTVSCIPHPQTTGAVVVLLRSRSQPSETEEQLTHLHRLQTVSVLAGNIAHDFNNLLTIISCNASTVLSTVSETDPLRRPLEDVQAAADEAAELNRDLTLYRHSTPLRQRRCDLNKVVTEALRLLRHAMPQGVSVSSELESDPLSVWGDPGQLRQAVVGLCLAARDMLTTGEDIRVTAARRSAKAPADSPGNEPQRGELATIRVTDAGDGSMARAFAQPVAPASSESLFGDALRLGRSVTAQIVDAHGGWIEAAAVPGRGSSVVICLPLHVVTGAPPAVEPDVACGPGPVLIADDDPMIVALLRTVLEGRGHQIVGTTTAGECVIALEQHTTTLGAVLLDHNLPRVRGATVFEHVRRIAPDVPVVLISGGLLDPESAPPSEDERTCRLAKPFMPADVLEALRSVCRSPAESVDS